MMNSSIYAMKTNNGNVKVVLDGEHYLKSKNADEIYEAAQEYRQERTQENRENLYRLLNPHHREVVEGPLEKDGLGNLYLEGYNQPLEHGMGDLLKSHLDEGLEIDPFIKFWERLQLNPSNDARQGFLNYIRDFGITITDEGYAMLYKAVNENSMADIDPGLVQFVGQEYLQHQINSDLPAPHEVFVVNGEDGFTLVGESEITTVDSPDTLWDFLTLAERQGVVSDVVTDIPTISGRECQFHWGGDIYQVSDFNDLPKGVEDEVELQTSTVSHEGRLDNLYSDIVNSHDSPFEPWYDGSYGMEIDLGQPQEMPREKCDPNSEVSCSEGLHVGSHEYVSTFGSNMDVILAVVVNPRDIVALPDYDHSKIRTCRYYPYAIMEREDDGSWTEIESVQVQTDELNDSFDYEGELQRLESQDNLSDLQADRKEILENRVNEVE